MDNIRTYLITVLVNKIHVKILRDSAVQLNGNHGIFAVHIFCLDINFRSVESGFPVGFCKRNILLNQQVTDFALGFFPIFLIAQILFAVIRIPFG